MAGSCSCNVTFGNTGVTTCNPAYKVFKKMILVPLVANDGTRNSIAKADVLNALYFNGKINNIDSSKRWYPLPLMKNVESTKADNITETFSDQSVIFVAEGVRGMNFDLVGQGTVLSGQLKQARCSDMGAFFIDGDGSLYGYTNNETDNLYPIPIDRNTWAPVWQMASDTTVQKIKITFQFDATLQDEYINQIASTDITGINLLSVTGLIDILSAKVSSTTTVIVVDMFTRFGSNFKKTPMKGLLVTDFYDTIGGAASKVFNTTTSTAVSLTSVVEDATIGGRYTITMSAPQTVTNLIRLTPNKTGFDFTEVSKNLIVI